MWTSRAGHSPATRYTRLGLCESIFLHLEYSVEFLIEYSSTQLTPKVATEDEDRVAQNKRSRFLIKGFNTTTGLNFEMRQNNARNASEILVKRNCKIRRMKSSRTKRHRNWHIFNLNFEHSSSKIKLELFWATRVTRVLGPALPTVYTQARQWHTAGPKELAFVWEPMISIFIRRWKLPYHVIKAVGGLVGLAIAILESSRMSQRQQVPLSITLVI